MAVVAWVLTAVYYFYQYAMRSAPAVMMPELSNAFGVTPIAVASIVGLFYYGYSPFSLVAGAAMDRFGRLDVIVNNAGLMTFKSLEELTSDDWLKVLNVDLFGAVHFTKQAFLTMKPSGAIVNVASIHAVMTEPLVAPYAAAKAAVVSLTRSASIEGKAKGIRVNVVLPGAIDTPMLWDNPNVKSGAEKVDRSMVGKPEDIAAAIAFLASEDAAFVTGTALRVDGGRLDRL